MRARLGTVRLEIVKMGLKTISETQKMMLINIKAKLENVKPQRFFSKDDKTRHL